VFVYALEARQVYVYAIIQEDFFSYVPFFQIFQSIFASEEDMSMLYVY